MNFAEGTVLRSVTDSHYDLRSSALVIFGVTPMHLFSKYQLQAQIFKIPARPVKYRPSGNLI